MSTGASKTIVAIVFGIVIGAAIIAFWPVILAVVAILATAVGMVLYFILHTAIWLLCLVGGVYIAYRLCKLIMDK